MTHKFSRRGLFLVLAGASVGWLLFIAGHYLDARRTSGLTYDELYGTEPAAFIYPSSYFTFVALALLGIIAIAVKGRLTGSLGLTQAVRSFVNLVLILTLVAGAIAGLGVFLNSFMATSGPGALTRIFNAYVPIVLYTVLIICLLIFGFVARRQQAISEGSGGLGTASVGSTRSEGSGGSTGAANGQRNVGLAFAVPIIAVALALLIGLITYDLTQSAPEVWIWVLIQVLAGGGIIAGTWYAARVGTSRAGESQVSPSRPEDGHAGGAARGAHTLNYVLSIIFAAVVGTMSLGYGIAAVQDLSSSPYLSLSIHQDDVSESIESGVGNANLSNTVVAIFGYDLAPNSAVQLEMSDSDFDPIQMQVDRAGNVDEQQDLPEDLAAGTYTFSARATTAFGEKITLESPMTVSASGAVDLDKNTFSTFEATSTQMLPVSGSWLLTAVVPAFVLWLLACAVVHITLVLRNSGGLGRSS